MSDEARLRELEDRAILARANAAVTRHAITLADGTIIEIDDDKIRQRISQRKRAKP